jgi:putative oxidoreductase
MNSLRTRDIMALLGRILLCCIFLVSAYAKITEWSASEQMMAAKELPAVPLLLGTAIAIELLGGLSILTGLFARQAALIIFLYLIPVTLIFHNFWDQGPASQPMQLVNFLKNLAIMGGLLELFSFGPGRHSFGSDRYEYPAERERTRVPAETQSATGVR